MDTNISSAVNKVAEMASQDASIVPQFWKVFHQLSIKSQASRFGSAPMLLCAHHLFVSMKFSRISLLLFTVMVVTIATSAALPEVKVCPSARERLTR